MIEFFKITKLKGRDREIVEDAVAREIPLTLVIGGKELVTLLCMPADLQGLVMGFLFTSGLIKKAQDVRKIVINDQHWAAYIDLADTNIAQEMVFKRLYTSGCGKGTLFYSPADIISRIKLPLGFAMEAGRISALMPDFQKKSEVFLKTGGAHSAALADKEKILIFKEDIGRHNAIDKVIGQALKDDISFEDKIMLTSGRISSEVLFKAQKCRIPVVVSQSAPTDQAVKLARDMNITLIGFARGIRMNIYSAPERIC